MYNYSQSFSLKEDLISVLAAKMHRHRIKEKGKDGSI